MEIKVPAASLAIPGENDGDPATMPESGDQVALAVEGKVSRVDGDQVFVAVDTVNGEAVPADPAPEAKDELDELMYQADKAGPMPPMGPMKERI